MLALAYSNRGVEWKARAISPAPSPITTRRSSTTRSSRRLQQSRHRPCREERLRRGHRDYDEAIRINPKYASALNNRGLAHFNKGQHQRAIADYDASIQLETDAVRLNNRGNAYASRGQYDRAIQDFDEAVATDPKYPIAYYNRGNAYYARATPNARSRTTTTRC